MSILAALLGSTAASIQTSGGGGPVFTPTYYEVAIPRTGVGSDLSNFPVWVRLSSMPASFWTKVRADGGNLRAYDTIGGTELALDVVSVMPFAQDGSIYVKVPTLFNAQATRFYIGCLSSDTTRRARADALGMNGVWTDYESVFVGGHVSPLADRAHPSRQFTPRGNLTLYEYKVAGTPGTAEAEASFAVASQSRAGIAHDPVSLETILIDNNTLRRYSSAWSLLTTNANPIGDVNTALGISTLTTCGDGCIVDGVLVVPMTNLGTNTVSAIACFNATTLALIGATNISATDPFISGLCWNESASRLVSCSWGTMTALRRYTLDTVTGAVTADGSITLTVIGGSFVNDAQGIEHWNGSYWIASEVDPGTIRVDEDGTCVYAERIVDYSSTSATLNGDYAGISQYRDGFMVLIWRATGDPNTFVYYQPLLNHPRGGAGLRMPENDSGVTAARLQVTGIPGSTVFTIGATSQRTQSNQMVMASFRNLASGGTDNRASLAVRQDGIRYYHNLWDDINLWVYSSTVSSPSMARVHGVYNDTSRTVYGDAAVLGSNAGITARGAAFDTFTIGIADEDGDSFSGYLSLVYLRHEAMSQDWIEAENLMTSDTTPFLYVKEVPALPYPTLGIPDAYIVATKTAAQAVGNTYDLVTFDNVIASSGWAFSSGSSFTVPAGIDLVEVNFMTYFTGFLSGGDTIAVIEKNGVEAFARLTDDQSWSPHSLRTLLPVASGDVISIRFQSYSGAANLSAQTRISIKGWNS